jgi:hypothetical protein
MGSLLTTLMTGVLIPNVGKIIFYNEYLNYERRRPTSVTFPPQIAYGLFGERTWLSAVRGLKWRGC